MPMMGRRALKNTRLRDRLPIREDRPRRIDTYLDYFGDSSLSIRLGGGITGDHCHPPEIVYRTGDAGASRSPRST